MDRRVLLKGMGAAALGLAARADRLDFDGSPKRVVVVGAGIIGASIAYHLAKRGARVTVVDAVGPASHASRGTLAWINATWAKQPQSYHHMNQQGVAAWPQLAKALGIPLVQNGSLEWFADPARQARLSADIEEQIAWGEPASMVDSDTLKRLEPKLMVDSGMTAAFSPNDAALDPVMATNALLDAVVAMGGRLVFPATVTGVTRHKDRLTAVETSAGSLAADKVVLATGAAPDIIGDLTGTPLPQRSTPGVIVITKPMPPIVNRIVAGPGAHLHQRPDGRVVMGEQAGAPNTARHAARLKDRPNRFPNRSFAMAHAQRIMALAAPFLPAIAKAQIDDVVIGWRPLPLDGHPVLGFAPGIKDIYVSVMHSGVTLAPIVGQLAAQEVLTDRQADGLDPYRPDRVFSDIKRY